MDLVTDPMSNTNPGLQVYVNSVPMSVPGPSVVMYELLTTLGAGQLFATTIHS